MTPAVLLAAVSWRVYQVGAIGSDEIRRAHAWWSDSSRTRTAHSASHSVPRSVAGMASELWGGR